MRRAAADDGALADYELLEPRARSVETRPLEGSGEIGEIATAQVALDGHPRIRPAFGRPVGVAVAPQPAPTFSRASDVDNYGFPAAAASDDRHDMFRTQDTKACGVMWVAAILATIALAGCGDGDGGTSSPSGRAADAAFIADMTAHHREAIQMARLARDRAGHPQIRRLAREIETAQEGEITVMRHITGHLGDPPEGAGGGHMSKAAMEMDVDPVMLQDAEPFDRAFIDMMIPHHQGAIAMAELHLHRGEHHNLRVMARRLIEAQTKEIAQLRRWREAWYGSTPQTADEVD